MSKFIEDRSYLKKKKKKETTKKKAAPSSPNKKQVANIANQVVNKTATTAKRTTGTVSTSVQRQQTVRRNVQKAVAENAPHRYNNRPPGAAQPSTNHTVQDRLAASRQRREQAEADIRRRRQENEARSQRISQSRNPRMQDTARGTKLPTLEERRQRQDRLREAQRQKMGYNSMASEEAQKTANRALKNTPTVVKESAKQVGFGHGKTLADITEANKSAAIGSKIDIKSKEFQEDIEKRRKESTRVAKSSFKTLSDMQEKSEQKMQKVTKDAKGLEKAYYGALESGTGMATDRLAGPAWAVSMLSRTYGNTRGQAQKEGATENEDRAYSLLQAAKEVATEYMFQGVGLAKGLSGSRSLAPAEQIAKYATRNLTGGKADFAHASIRLLGGVGEENLEEVAGWGLDPFIKEFTYGRNVRTRKAQQMLREQSDALRSNITSMDDARAMAAYLSSEDFLEQQVRTYMDSGIGEKEARDLAENMRDYLDASLSGDTEKMADIEESMSKKLSGRNIIDIAKQDLSLSELKDTIESTTLLTATTGLPGTFSTAARGAAIKEQLGSDGIRALAKTAEDFEDGEMQLKAKAMSDRLDAGKDITSTQAYDLAVGVQEQYNKDADRQQTAYQTAQKTIKSEKLVTPYRVSRDGDIQMDEVTDKTYQSTAKSAKSSIETFIKNSDGKESLTDTEIDRGSRAIAGFKTGVFTVDDANELNFRNTAVRSAFEAETGVDLSEYVVKGKNGQIDIPATNTATKNALFAKAADNLVATAQAETANWVDNTKGEVVTQISRRMGASGTAALQTALDDVDERDRSSYMMTANASDVLYQSARNMGTEWENAKDYAKRMFPNVAEDKLKAMYEAGLADRDMATDEARGQQIKIGEKVELKKQSDVPTGQVIIETSAPVKGSVIRTFTELARNLGVDIHLVDHFTDKDGKVLKNVNGEYIDGNIFINVNSDFEKNMGFIFMHEVTHHLKLYAPEQYKALENLVREKWFKYDSAQMQSEIAKKIETYAKHGQTLTEEQALEEIIADAAHEFLTDRNFAREVANEDATLAQAVLTSIRNALRMLRRIMSADNLDETHMNTLFSQLDILDEAERLWLDAYKQAVRNNAAVAVDRLQNQIYEEGRQSISETSDADYMDAVNRDDTKSAQKMVDKAAKNAGFTVKGYHGTTNNFNTFKSGDIGFHFGKNKSTARTRVGRGKNAKIIPAWLSLDNPIKVAVDFGSWDADYRLAEYLRDEGIITPEEYQDALTVDNGTRRVKRSTKGANDALRNILKGKGYDGIEYENYYEAEGATSYIVFDAAQIKNADPVTYDDNGDVIPLSERFNQSSPDIRYSIGEEAREALNTEGIEELADGTTARYSVTSWQETNKEKKLKALTAANHDEKTAKKWIEAIDSIASIILGDPERLDYEADRSNKFLKPNGDYYKYTLDASTLCDKRRIYQGTYNAIQHAMPNIPLMQDDVVRIRTLLKEKDHKAPCGICYVESQRKNLGAYAKEWYDNYARKDEIRLEDVTTSDGLKELKKTNPEVAADFEKAMAAKGVSSPKVVKLRTDYREDIMRMRPSTIEYLNSIGGLRFHSFSDFETPHLIDTMQAVMDMATKNLMGMAYAKVPNFAAVFGPTGIKINLSLIAKTDENGNAVHDENGRLVFDSVEGIPYEEAKKWRDAYPDNVAFILVGKDKEHTLEAINDDRVDFVIPFHRSKWSAEDMRRLGLVGYEDFATGHQENGIFVSEFWDYNKTGKENAERYLEVCKERGVTPIFEQLLHDNGDGTYSLQEDGSTDNYWKLLVEGKMYNHITKKGAPQQPVQPNFNMEEARRVLKEYEGGANELPVADDVVEAFVKEYKEAHPDAEIADARLSIAADLDEPYMAAVNAGNMEEAQEYVDEAAKRAGMRVAHRYHGSMNANFTVFSKAHAKVGGNSGAGFYFSTSKADSTDHYADVDGADNYFKWSALADTIMDAGEWNGETVDDHDRAIEIAKEELNKSPGVYDVYLNYQTPYIRNYGRSTDLFSHIMDGFDESIVDRDDYEDEDSYEEDLTNYRDEYFFGRVSDAVYAAYDQIEQNYDYVDLPNISDVISEIGGHYDYNFTWDGIERDLYNMYEVTIANEDWDETGDGTRELTRAIIENLGFDAIVDKEVSDKFGQLSREMQSNTEHIIVFKPEQIKLSDPVTYAEDGSVIPLSERFDPTNNDIRYSMSTEDADGNVLTTNQMEYFKNSQARDAQGRLVPVYHTTNKGGFTVFDPMRSDDHRSLFFAEDWDTSQTYGNYANSRFYYYDIDNIDDVKKYLDAYSPDRYFVTQEQFDQAGGWEADMLDFENVTNGEQSDFAKYLDNPDGYIAIIGVPDYSPDNTSYADTWVMAKSPDELVRELHNHFGWQRDNYRMGTQHGYYACYLNLEDPYIIDAHGDNWNEIHLDDYDDVTFNTREIAEMAMDMDFDGVIIRNLVDQGGMSPYDGMFDYSDIYIAFSSNQVKDINNENPTENPDIRFSFTEDEIKSGVDYDHATDMSYEELQMYEDMISKASESSDIESAFGKAFDGEKVSNFYSALTEEVGMVFDDEILEEGRMRMAKSKADFWSNLNTKWQERWETKGEVLDAKSVKTNVRNLIRGVMNNSAADGQYKTELLNKTLMDMRVAYQLMKQDRTDIASALLYHSALRMISDVEFIRDDTEYQEYKGIRDYLRGEPITVGEDYWQGKAFQQFRKEHYGMLKLRKGANGNIGEVYAQLENLYPHIFNETEREKHGFGDGEEDLLQYIGFVTEQNMQPFTEAYSSEECAEWAFEIADDLYEIMENGEGVTSLADRYKAKYDAKAKAMKTRHAEAILRVRKQKDAAIDALKEHYNERLDEQKARSRDAIRKEREKFRQQNQAAKKKAKERTLHKQMFESIKDDYDWLTNAVLDPTKTKYIPEAFRASLANLLMQMDLETARSKQLEEKYGRVTNKTLKLRELRDRLNDMATAKAGDDTNLFDIDQYLPYLMDSLAKKYDGQPVSALDVDSLRTIKLLFKALRKNFQNLNRESAESKAAIAAAKASKIVEESAQKVSRDGEAKTYEGFKGGMSTINMTSLTPPYFFERMGTVNDIYKELRGGFDTYIRNEAEIMDKIKGIVGGYYKKRNIRKNRPTPGSELASWRDSRSAKEIKLTHGTVTMTVAQRMSLLCLANREQARKHMVKGGIIVTPYEASSKIEAFKEGRNGKKEWGDKVILSASDLKADIDAIKASLTQDQIKVAQQLQQLMAVDMAKLGNEAHREMYGYEIFGDPDYFPIKSKDTWIAKDVNNMTDAIEKIKSFGPAKPLDANASNAIVVDDIFSVVADHCNGMNLYNAYLVPISNFMRVYNSTPTLENGTRKPVRDALEEAYGKKAMQYIDNFIRDLNGIKNNNRGGLEDLMNKAIGATKATAVAGNLRVAAQQPTAIVRAAAEMQWKYLAPFVKAKPQRGAMKEMFKYCPIAQWKSWGFYDTYMGRDIEDVMMNNWSKMDVALSGIYGTLDNLTWTAIWQGVKSEQHDLHPEMDIKSDEFLKMCGERASEIFDKTQVVDSTFHRSDAMRNKQVAVKLFTAFMSEPTLTLNVFRSALYDFGELKKAGKTDEANKRLAKALTVLVAQAAFVSVAQALVDAWRDKEPGFPWGGDDDDEDEETTYWVRFLQNLSRNFIDQLHLENNLYLVKDVKPYADFMMSKMTGFISGKLEQDGHEFASDAIDLVRAIFGWDQEYLYNQNNLVFASLENTANGTAQLFKKLEKGDEYDKKWYDILQKLASGISPLLGIPAGTLMRDFKPVWDKVFSSVFAADEEASSETKSEKGENDSDSKSGSKKKGKGKSSGEAPAVEEKEEYSTERGFFGLGKSEYQRHADDEKKNREKRIKEAKDLRSKAQNMSASEKDKAIWDSVSTYMEKQTGKSMTALVESADYDTIREYRAMYMQAGGDISQFDARIQKASKTALKKTLIDDPSPAQQEAQYYIRTYLETSGLSDEEMSEIVYKTDSCKDLKVAFRMNDEEAINYEMQKLANAGMRQVGFEKVYKNRMRLDLKKYKESGGKYAEKLKSMGDYNWPCNGTITSTFGHRSSPGGIGSTNHQGIDIGASMGAPVTAADGGVVVRSGWYGGYGKTVQIQHDDGTITQYSHLSWWEPKVGDVVAQGQEIGKVGSTGNSTGPHLHFGVMKNGEYVDPMDYLNKKS